MSLAVGDIVRTSYGTGPFEVLEVWTGCTCPKYLDQLNFPGRAPASAPHIHLVARDLRNGKKAWLSGYEAETLRSVWNRDWLLVVKAPGAQGELDFGRAAA